MKLAHESFLQQKKFPHNLIQTSRKVDDSKIHYNDAITYLGYF